MGDPCPRLPGETDDELAIRWRAKLQDYGRTAERVLREGLASPRTKPKDRALCRATILKITLARLEALAAISHDLREENPHD